MGPVATHEHISDGILRATLPPHAPHFPPLRRGLLPQVLLINAGRKWSYCASDSTSPLHPPPHAASPESNAAPTQSRAPCPSATTAGSRRRQARHTTSC